MVYYFKNTQNFLEFYLVNKEIYSIFALAITEQRSLKNKQNRRVAGVVNGAVC
jgi:hypothetical protein